MAIFLRHDVTTYLLEENFGGFDGLIVEWERRSEAPDKFPSHRKRSSIYRWLKEGLPSTGVQLAAFCGLLDVDPLAVFDYNRNGYFSKFAIIRRNLQLGLAAAGVYSPLYRIYRPGPFWPSDPHAKQFYGRDWCGVEFTNADHWDTQDYVLVKVNFREPVGTRPRAAHIAYRRQGSRDTMWRYYGTVLSIAGQLELYSEGGDFQTMPVVEPNEIRFRTYYGGRPVEFRVASLHAFDLDTQFPFNDRSTIGFDW